MLRCLSLPSATRTFSSAISESGWLFDSFGLIWYGLEFPHRIQTSFACDFHPAQILPSYHLLSDELTDELTIPSMLPELWQHAFESCFATDSDCDSATDFALLLIPFLGVELSDPYLTLLGNADRPCSHDCLSQHGWRFGAARSLLRCIWLHGLRSCEQLPLLSS